MQTRLDAEVMRCNGVGIYFTDVFRGATAL